MYYSTWKNIIKMKSHILIPFNMWDDKIRQVCDVFKYIYIKEIFHKIVILVTKNV